MFVKMSAKRSLMCTFISMSVPAPKTTHDNELGLYGEDAKRHVCIEELIAPPRPNQLHQQPFDEEREFFLRMADWLGVQKDLAVEARLWEMVKFYSNHHPVDWCICLHVPGPVPEGDHNSDCQIGDWLKQGRLRREAADRLREEQAEQGQRRIAATRQLAFALERGWSSETAAFMSDAGLQLISRHVTMELEHRHGIPAPHAGVPQLLDTPHTTRTTVVISSSPSVAISPPTPQAVMQNAGGVSPASSTQAKEIIRPSSQLSPYMN